MLSKALMTTVDMITYKLWLVTLNETKTNDFLCHKWSISYQDSNVCKIYVNIVPYINLYSLVFEKIYIYWNKTCFLKYNKKKIHKPRSRLFIISRVIYVYNKSTVIYFVIKKSFHVFVTVMSNISKSQ